ncbi:hypothetical protein P9760_20005, partial [Parageobacillus thermoglucosidasius]|uniref:hypothetical protein n=1 Tax=Parageobacillus thermoglucosidasius TaxID=1426 RepID=UPI002E2247CD|nr:hypothetical protein [Parageobacillus thermoglucosidasius]
ISTCSLENDVSVRAVDNHLKHIGSHDLNDESLVPVIFRLFRARCNDWITNSFVIRDRYAIL